MHETSPKDIEIYGHGRVYCSCGIILSYCKCHTNYAIRLKSCNNCIKPKLPPDGIKKNKRKIKGKVTAVKQIQTITDAELKKLMDSRSREKRRLQEQVDEEAWMVEQETKNEQ